MPQITLSDACYNELKAALAGSSMGESPRPTPTPTTPPAQPPSDGNWQADAHARAAQHGFSHAVLFDWDWSGDGGVVYDTSRRGQIGQRGCFVASFVAQGAEDGMQALITAVGYPVTQGNQLTMSLSDLPCDFSVTDPAISISTAPTIAYCVGSAPVAWWSGKPTAVGLVPGRRYFISVCGRDTNGQFSCDSADARGCEIRIEMRVPQGY